MASPAPPLRVDLVADIETIEALGPEWAALEERTPEATGFQSFAWCRAWLGAGGEACEARVITVREDDRLVALLPLQIDTRFGVRIARWLGEPMTQYGDALAEAGERRRVWLAAALDELEGHADVDLYAFMRLRADGVFAGCGGAAPASIVAPFIDFSQRPAPRRRQKSQKRREQRLAAFGTARVEEASEAPERARLALAALSLKREWLRSKGLVSLGLSNGKTGAFLENLARSGFLRAHALRLGEEIAALELGFVGGGAYRSLLGSYDLRFQIGAPGHALTARLIETCAAEGLAGFDFLAPGDSYKLSAASGATPILQRMTARTLRGRIASFALTSLRPAAKKLLAALAGLRTVRPHR